MKQLIAFFAAAATLIACEAPMTASTSDDSNGKFDSCFSSSSTFKFSNAADHGNGIMSFLQVSVLDGEKFDAIPVFNCNTRSSYGFAVIKSNASDEGKALKIRNEAVANGTIRSRASLVPFLKSKSIEKIWVERTIPKDDQSNCMCQIAYGK